MITHVDDVKNKDGVDHHDVIDDYDDDYKEEHFVVCYIAF